MTELASTNLKNFLERWRHGGGAELANSQTYLIELCELLGVPRPDPAQKADIAANSYVFEMPVVDPYQGHASTKRIDLYRRDCFVLEAKQGSQAQPSNQASLFALAPQVRHGQAAAGIGQRGSGRWRDAMARARSQAQGYVHLLPEGHRPPAFLLVADVGYCIEVWANFARDGKAYHQFPSQAEFRIFHEPQEGREAPTLADPEVLQRLRAIWLAPEQLDPSTHAAKVSRAVAAVLAELARSLEVNAAEGREGYDAATVAQFLMRCMFTMFAEDVGLLPPLAFRNLLKTLRGQPHAFPTLVQALWQEMDAGTEVSRVLEGFPKIRIFNGRLFRDPTALPLTPEQIDILIRAANYDWAAVEPAIFGTLLERALDPRERHRLGAHYTPRAYVERLVEPTILEPMRTDWQRAQAEAYAYEAQRPGTGLPILERFHQTLCRVRVLDPACGSGNFLYVSLDLLKRLEGEVFQAIDDLRAELQLPARGRREGDEQAVHPRQFFGIEVNPRAAVIAEAVLWIGYLQWQQRNLKANDPELVAKLAKRPVLERLGNIENRDAVLAWDGAPEGVDVIGEDGRPVTDWDGVTTKVHPVTGLAVPDESAVRVRKVYPNARKAVWPEVEFVVGNPPFIGTKRMRALLGDGYVEALRTTYAGDVEDNADFVMYWWFLAATLANKSQVRRYGFITSNSITQNFNRRVIDAAIRKQTVLNWAVPDHPWTDSETGAAVRVAMTVASPKGIASTARLVEVLRETTKGNDGAEVVLFERQVGALHADLRAGANVAAAKALQAMGGVAGMGVALHGSGFILDPAEADALGGPDNAVIRRYVGGRDLLRVRRELYVVDFSFMSEEAAQESHPAAFQRVLLRVKPERDQNRREAIRKYWWRFGWERPKLRTALAGLDRFIVTTETSKHRVFQFLAGDVLPDHGIIAIATDDAYVLGVLSSRIHIIWSLAAGGRLGVGNDPRYNKAKCLDPFPFPDASQARREEIRKLADHLDRHRKDRQAAHPDVTLTGMYNVVEALREGRALTTKERKIHDDGLCSLLHALHTKLDAAVAAAYGWPADLDDEAILVHLVDLNSERVAEEADGHIRWLRPEYQAPETVGRKPEQLGLIDFTANDDTDDEPVIAAAARPSFPRQPGPALEALLAELGRRKEPASVEQLASVFDGANPAAVDLLLHSMATFGAALEVDDGRWVVL